MIFIYKISTTKHTKYPTKEILCVQCRPLRLLKFFDGLRSWGNKKRERPNKMGWKKTLTTGLEQKAYTDRSLQNSTVWFYQELARRIGEKKYNKYLKACKYGNHNIGKDLTTFWMGESSALQISPKNQLEFLVKLHEEKLPFSKRTFEIVKRVMIREQTIEYILRAKTGWAQAGGKDIGWFVGYVEKKDNLYFFALRVNKPLEKEMPEFVAKRIEISHKILQQMGIL